MRNKGTEFIVGLFMLSVFMAFAVLAFKVSGLTSYFTGKQYDVYADFDNIGQLKVRAPVMIAGVHIGEVKSISLDRETFRARVKLGINMIEDDIPTDSSASILTAGLLGANYISISPGFDATNLQNMDKIETTRSALILENLIGQVLFSLKSNDKE